MRFYEVPFLVVCAVLTLVNSCQNVGNNSFTDPRDGKTYKTVKIGNQVWMAENLDYNLGAESFCFNDDTLNCNRYGRLYTWEAAQQAIPDGWRLPTKDEFEELLDHLGGEGEASYPALAEGGKSGLNLLLGGLRYDDRFLGLERGGLYWSSSEYDEDIYVLFMSGKSSRMEYSFQTNFSNMNKKNACSVRCVKV